MVDAILAKEKTVTDFNGELLEKGNTYPLGRGSRIGTGDNGHLKIIWGDNAVCGQYLEPASLIVAVGRDSDRLNAGNSSETSLERGSLASHLNTLAVL